MRNVLSILCSLLLGLSCYSQEDNPSITIVVIGSSTAAGYGPSTKDSAWVWRMRRYVRERNRESDVVNLARGGYTTYKLMPSNFIAPPRRPQPDTVRNITHALSFHPDGIIINLPSNDVSSGYRTLEQLRNFDIMVDLAKQNDIPIWVCTSQPRNFDDAWKLNEQSTLRDSILHHYGTGAIDFWSGFANTDNSILPSVDSGDGIHMNDTAHGVLFERVKEAGVIDSIQRKVIFDLHESVSNKDNPIILCEGEVSSTSNDKVSMKIIANKVVLQEKILTPGTFKLQFNVDFTENIQLEFSSKNHLTSVIQLELDQKAATTGLNFAHNPIPLLPSLEVQLFTTDGLVDTLQPKVVLEKYTPRAENKIMRNQSMFSFIQRERIHRLYEEPLDGTYKRFDEFEKHLSTVKYKRGKLHGKCIWYRGEAQWKMSFKNGKRHGKNIGYCSNGKKFTIERYKNGERVKTKYLRSCGHKW